MIAPRVRVSEDPAAACATHIEKCLQAAIEQRGLAHLAVCGGSTPAPTYHALQGAALDWSRVSIYFGDERCVPPGSPDSTYALIQSELLDGLPAAPQVHRMRGEDPNFGAAAKQYAALLPERLDVAFLGMGPDGHTASLFPGDPAAVELVSPVVHIVGPKPPPHRLTMTPRVLLLAHERAVLVTGSAKAKVLAEVLEGPDRPEQLPAQVARDGAWFLDPAAAAALQNTTR